MRGPGPAAGVFSMLVAAVCSLKCVSYHHPAYDQQLDVKAGQVIDCSSDQDVCLLVYYILQHRNENKMNGFRYLRKCGSSSQCDLQESLTSPTYIIRYSTTCCSTDSCLPPPPIFPKVDEDKNGVTCPACHSTKDNPCVPEKAMECTGNETHCIFFNETMFQVYTVHSFGCGSQNTYKDKGRLVALLSFYSTITITKIKPNPELEIGNFLWCHACYDENSATCTKQRMLCATDEDVCVSEKRRIVDEKSRRLTMQIRRRCGKSPECKFSGVITSKEKSMTIKTSCCDTDMCTPEEPQWSLKRRKNNGRTCPNCFPTNSSKCRSTDVVHCNADETRCIHYTNNISDDTYVSSEVYNGCSSPGICQYQTRKRFQFPDLKTVITTEILCSRGIRNIGQLLSVILSKCAVCILMRL